MMWNEEVFSNNDSTRNTETVGTKERFFPKQYGKNIIQLQKKKKSSSKQPYFSSKLQKACKYAVNYYVNS